MHKVHRVPLQGPKEPLVLKEPKVPQELKVRSKVTQGHKEDKVLKVLKVLRVLHKDILVSKVLRVLLELKGLREQLKELKDP